MKEKMKLKFTNKNVNKKKNIIVMIAIIAIIIFICFFIKNHYKSQNFGNNMSNKNIEEIEEYILNISSYQARIEITVESNKNTNKYLIEQTYKKDNISKQVVLEPSNIEGMEIIYENNILKINNSKMNLSTVYENYQYIVDNFLWLNSFIQDYKDSKDSNSAVVQEENDMIIMEAKTKNENNKYIYNKKLYIDKKTGKPTKLLIQDVNKKSLVYILYNEITVNGLH